MDDRTQSEIWDRSAGETRADGYRDREDLTQKSSGIDTPQPVASRPFVWQCGRRLLFLEREVASWVFAELEFDPRTCCYIELRRARYRWEREALGVLLSRALPFGDDAATEAALLVESWTKRRR